MKWTKKYPRDCDKRVIKKFAFFPIAIDNGITRNYRWAETCYIRQTYRGIGGYWKDIGFVEKSEYEKYILDERLKDGTT